MVHLAWLVLLRGEVDRGGQLSAEALQVYRDLGDQRGMSRALNNLAFLAVCRDPLPETARRYQEVLALNRSLEDPRGITYALTCLARVRIRTGDFPGAFAALDEALRAPPDIGYDLWTWVRAISAEAELAQGRIERARELLEQLLPILHEQQLKTDLGFSLSLLGATHLEQGSYRSAEPLLLQAYEFLSHLDFRVWALEPAIRLGHLAGRVGRAPEARARYAEAARGCLAIGDCWGLSGCCLGLAELAAAQGQAPRAAALMEVADGLLRSIGAVRTAGDRRRYDALTGALGAQKTARSRAGAAETQRSIQRFIASRDPEPLRTLLKLSSPATDTAPPA